MSIAKSLPLCTISLSHLRPLLSRLAITPTHSHLRRSLNQGDMQHSLLEVWNKNSILDIPHLKVPQLSPALQNIYPCVVVTPSHIVSPDLSLSLLLGSSHHSISLHFAVNLPIFYFAVSFQIIQALAPKVRPLNIFLNKVSREKLCHFLRGKNSYVICSFNQPIFPSMLVYFTQKQLMLSFMSGS